MPIDLLLIIGLVVLLYIRTLDYKYIIDDSVKRAGYMYEVPLTSPAPDFFDTKPTRLYRCFMIGMHCVNVSIIYLLWGWAPALLFAVHPMSVWGTAWVTGNYYATTGYFCLIAYFILHTWPNVWGALLAAPIFVSALNSTVCSINFPFLFLFGGTPWGLTLLLPLAWYFRGKKFTTGIKIRKSFVTGKKVKREIKLNRLVLMTKVVARYTFTSLYPNRLGLFSGFGNELNDNPEAYKRMHSANSEFWGSLALVIGVFAAGMVIHPFGTLWFFVLIGLHSQFNLMGQFYAERYLYLPVVGLCIVAGAVLVHHPIALTVVATILVVRTHFFIPTFRDMESLWKSDLEAYPGFGESYSNLAQYYMNRKPLPAWRINEIASLLFRADLLSPNNWKVQMNIACFFAITQQWQQVLKHTEIAIKLLEDIGGEVNPVHTLYKQKKDVEALLSGAIVQQQNGELTALSHQKEGRDEGKTEQKASGVPECVGNAGT
jgi:hypothetical protein